MLWEFMHPDRFVLGAIGKPGQRRFILQIAKGSQLVAVEVEKEQALLLGRRLHEVLDQLINLGQLIPESFEPRDMGPLDAPLTIDFKVGGIGLAWDSSNSCAQIELYPMPGLDDDFRLIQVWLSPLKAREFAGRALRIVASGRPSCPVCGQPIDGSHICPRSNGYRRPLF